MLVLLPYFSIRVDLYTRKGEVILGVGKMALEEPILRGGSSRTKFVWEGFENITKTKALRILEGTGANAPRRIIDMGNFALNFPERRKEIKTALVIYHKRHGNTKRKKLTSKMLHSILAIGMLEAMV